MKIRSFRRPCSHLYKKRGLGHRLSQRATMQGHSKKAAVYEPRREASEETALPTP